MLEGRVNMNTLTTPRPSTRQLSGTSHPIGDNTDNVAFNLPTRALYVLKTFLKGSNRSAFIRSAIAEAIQRKDTWSGLAFRAAVGLKNFAQSLWSPLPHAEKASVCQESASATPEHPVPCGGEKLIADANDEFDNEAVNFIPKTKE
jgi:hypothetical protein